MLKVWWDGKKKAPIWSRINPLLSVPDPFGDYFAWEYRYIGFYGLKQKRKWKSSDGIWQYHKMLSNERKEQKRVEQQNNWLNHETDNTIFDVYYHFEKEGEEWMMYVTNSNCTHFTPKQKLKKSPFLSSVGNLMKPFYGNPLPTQWGDVQKWNAEMKKSPKTDKSPTKSLWNLPL